VIPPALTILDTAGESLGGFLPRLGGALVLLVVGILVARLVGRAVEKALSAGGADGLAERGGVHDALEQVGLPRSIARVLGRAVRWGLTAVVVFAALSLLGLMFLSDALNEGVLLLPNLLVAALLLLAGVVLAGLARDRVERLTGQMDLPISLGRLAQIAVLAVFAITAAAQVAISTAILMVLVGVVLFAVAGTFALAFGLGGRDAARAISAGRYVRGSFQVGQTITVAGQTGEIVALEATSTVLQAAGGPKVHVPNHLLFESVVTVKDEGGGAGSG